MRLARLRAGIQVALCEIFGEEARPLIIDTNQPWLDPLRVWLEDEYQAAPQTVLALSETTLLAPVRAPQKIVAVGLNYRAHAIEQGKEVPTSPMLFSKAPSAIIGDGEVISWSKSTTTSVDYEVELAVVIGRRARNVTEAEALDFVLGYTVCNDVSARDLQKADGQYFRAKSFDTFCPLGPTIVTKDEIEDPQRLQLRTRVNGEVHQDSSTSDMIFGVAEVISYCSRHFTLEPGDVIATGTPAGVGSGRTPPVFLQDGDVVEVEIDGIGLLKNPVAITD